MSMEELRQYESKMHEETNKKVGVVEPLPVNKAEPTTPSNTPNDSADEHNASWGLQSCKVINLRAELIYNETSHHNVGSV